jgi:hypothetical protein
MSIEEYRRLLGGQPDIVDLLSTEDQVDLRPEKLDLTATPAEL